ncbi:hypothetical protein AB0L63_27725 [Nocardia sp. NPDC051990]
MTTTSPLITPPPTGTSEVEAMVFGCPAALDGSAAVALSSL